MSTKKKVADKPRPVVETPTLKKSKPFAIWIKNTSESEMEVDLFNAAGNLSGHFTKKGELVQNDYIFIGSAFSNTESEVTYRDILHASMQNPFAVGLYYANVIRSDYKGSSVMNASVIKVYTRDANGTFVLIPIVAVRDPHQFQDDIIIVDQEFNVDGFTGIKFMMTPNSKVIVNVYPSIVIYPAMELTDRSIRKYENPKVGRFSKDSEPRAFWAKNPEKQKEELKVKSRKRRNTKKAAAK